MIIFHFFEFTCSFYRHCLHIIQSLRQSVRHTIRFQYILVSILEISISTQKRFIVSGATLIVEKLPCKVFQNPPTKHFIVAIQNFFTRIALHIIRPQIIRAQNHIHADLRPLVQVQPKVFTTL